jgi:CheY-like chemotaxis protein
VVAFVTTFNDAYELTKNTQYDAALLDVNITTNEFDGLELMDK